MAAWGVPGVSVAVFEGGEILWAGGFGVRIPRGRVRSDAGAHPRWCVAHDRVHDCVHHRVHFAWRFSFDGGKVSAVIDAARTAVGKSPNSDEK